MKAGKVMELLQISRSTLKRYRENGVLKAKRLPSGQYLFDDESVFLLKNGRSVRLTLIYGRVSTYSQKHYLDDQMHKLQDFAEKKGYQISGSYQDIASGISFKDRKQFFKMLELILDGKVERVIVTHQDRLSRVGFEMFEYLFEKYNTTIEVISDKLNFKTDEQELPEEIINLFQCFSIRECSHTRNEHKLIE